MNCSSCDQPFSDGEEVEVSFPAYIVGGKVVQSEEEAIRHADDCLDSER